MTYKTIPLVTDGSDGLFLLNNSKPLVIVGVYGQTSAAIQASIHLGLEKEVMDRMLGQLSTPVIFQLGPHTSQEFRLSTPAHVPVNAAIQIQSLGLPAKFTLALMVTEE